MGSKDGTNKPVEYKLIVDFGCDRCKADSAIVEGNQAKRISYFRLKNDVGSKNMRQTFDLLVLRRHHSASL